MTERKTQNNGGKTRDDGEKIDIASPLGLAISIKPRKTAPYGLTSFWPGLLTITVVEVPTPLQVSVYIVVLVGATLYVPF